MHKISYSKFFLSGLLEGLSVRCSFSVPKEECARYCAGLSTITRDNAAGDAVTGDAFYVYNVGCEEVL